MDRISALLLDARVGDHLPGDQVFVIIRLGRTARLFPHPAPQRVCRYGILTGKLRN